MTISTNTLWGHLLIEEFVRHGVSLFCVCPGSRSTPLTAAISRNPRARSIVCIDERAAAFYALGFARATGTPAVFVCTSGTALANALPAVVEAYNDNVPLLICSADRPPEHHHTGANQTIQQADLFHKVTRWQTQLPTPDPQLPLHFLLTTVAQAVHQASRHPAGPVHINWPLREPLAPAPTPPTEPQQRSILDALPPGALAGLPARWRESTEPYTTVTQAPATLSTAQLETLRATIEDTKRGILVLGRLPVHLPKEPLCALIQALDWPLFADIGAGLRLGPHLPQRIAHSELLLSHDEVSRRLRPDTILHLGGPFVSKRLLRFLQQQDSARLIHVHPQPTRQDPSHRVSIQLECDLQTFCHALLPHLAASTTASRDKTLPLRPTTAPPATTHPRHDASTKTEKASSSRAKASSSRAEASFPRTEASSSSRAEEPASSWRAQWQALDVVAHGAIEVTIPDTLSEPGTARMIAQMLPATHGLFVANSMPIRDLDRFAPSGGRLIPIGANRGASGIDGTIATAIGFAHGLQAPVTLLLGDLSLLHDLNSLALLQDAPQPVHIVVQNNQGGGIFHFLPIAQCQDIFEPYFATAHQLSFVPIARAFGLDAYTPQDPKDLKQAYLQASAKPHASLIEVHTRRDDNHTLHQQLDEAVQAAIDVHLNNQRPAPSPPKTREP